MQVSDHLLDIVVPLTPAICYNVSNFWKTYNAEIRVFLPRSMLADLIVGFVLIQLSPCKDFVKHGANRKGIHLSSGYFPCFFKTVDALDGISP